LHAIQDIVKQQGLEMDSLFQIPSTLFCARSVYGKKPHPHVMCNYVGLCAAHAGPLGKAAALPGHIGPGHTQAQAEAHACMRPHMAWACTRACTNAGSGHTQYGGACKDLFEP